jgi:proteic killer suppression protein
VIVSFADTGTEDVFNGRDTKSARKSCPANLWNVAWRKLDQLHSATRLETLRTPPGNRLEALKGDRKGQHSIRVNQQFRICFIWTGSGAEGVEIVDYHY